MKYLIPGVSWATNATYPAGSNPWNGGPTKVQPSTAIQAAGVEPNAQFSAQEFNWLENNRQIATTIQAHAAMRDWHYAAHLLTGGTGTDIVAVRSTAANFTNAMNDRQRWISVFGPNSGDSNKLYQAVSPDARLWQSSGKVVTVGAPFTGGYTYTSTDAGIVAGEPGVLWTMGSTPILSADMGATWNENQHYTNGAITLGMHWAPFSGGTYIAVNSDGGVCVGTSAGASTNHTIAGVTDFVAAGGVGYAEITDNGAGTICFVARANADTNYSIFTSTDSGATWAKTLSLAGTHASIVYNAASGVFAAFDDSGLFYAGTGSVWTTKTTGITPGSTFVGRAKMASAGPAIAFAYGITGLWRGVVYTFDLGATWNTWAFASANGIQALRGANGRLYALADDKIWQSGQLASPDADLVT